MPSLAAASPQVDVSDGHRRARRLVALAAAWLWSVAVAVPVVDAGAPTPAALGALAAFPAVVTLGLFLERRPRPRPPQGTSPRAPRNWLRRHLADAVLLGVAPPTLALTVPTMPLETRWDVAVLAADAVGAALYVAAAAQLARERLPSRTERSEALPASARHREAVWPRRVRRALVGLFGAASFGLVAVAPTIVGREVLVARHGEGADAALTFASTVGLAVAVMILGVILAPALRAPALRALHAPASSASPSAQPGRRVVPWLVVSALASLLWMVLRWLDR